jgi:hypothetical protein
MGKKKSRELCRAIDLDINIEATTDASKNTTANHYWANPKFDFLSNSWWLLLEDNNNNKLHVFNIPPNAISENQVQANKDNPKKIELNIKYEDESFEDICSGVNFAKWHVKTISSG